MVRSAYREAVGASSRRSVPSRICQRRATRAGHRSPARPARRSSRRVTWAHSALREAEASPRPFATRVGWDRCLAFCQTISTTWGRMTRPSPRRSARSHSPQPARRSCCKRWRTATSVGPTKARATIVRQLSVSGGPWRPSRGRAATSASVRSSCPPCSPVPPSPHAMPSWANSLRSAPWGRGAADCRRAVAHPSSFDCLLGLGLLALRQGNLHRALPLLERAVGICQDADLPALFPQMAATLGVAYPVRTRRRRRAAAQACDGTDHCNGKGSLSDASVVSP